MLTKVLITVVNVRARHYTCMLKEEKESEWWLTNDDKIELTKWANGAKMRTHFFTAMLIVKK